ncbi:MAG TPA: hypothetical protein VFF73_23800, partial [Planctomycetota bacterium]|nr:hypothetical protein [Planctomycetota bacterium]
MSFAGFSKAVRVHAAEHPVAVFFMALAIVVRVVFWAVTDRQFEDGLITITHARNAALGLGLIHHPGEGRVHGFTSALSVLVPLVGELLHPGSGMLALRLASLASAAAAIGLAEAIARRLALAKVPTAFALAYLALERNQVFFGMAGMETQMAVATLLLATLSLMEGKEARSGVALGLALLVRPDFLLFVGPALLLAGARRGARLGGIALAVCSPWLVFTTIYYGSPVPHTILAKSAIYDPVPWHEGTGACLEWIGLRVHDHRHDWRYFCPFLFGNPSALPIRLEVLFAEALAFLGLVVAGLIATFKVESFRPAAAYVVLYVFYRVLLLPNVYYEWYLPPFQALDAILAAAGLTWLGKRLPRAAVVLSLGLSIFAAIHLPWTLAIERESQRRDDATRKPLGLFLARVVPPGEPVMSESAGYVGYYSNVLLWDYPGLTSSTVRQA